MKFILASSSPRRRDLLNMLGIDVDVQIPKVSEIKRDNETVKQFIKRIAIDKGETIEKMQSYITPIISADTIVLCDDSIIGKPRDRSQAYDFLKVLANNIHEVYTGVSIIYKGITHYDLAVTKVEFDDISDVEINRYLDHEHYMDKAGAYAIQGRAAIFIKKIHGCYFNVMGFPHSSFLQNG